MIIEQIIPESKQNEIRGIVYSLDTGDNSEKQDAIKRILRSCGINQFRTGTNRICGYIDAYPEFAIKVAIDKRGVEDNDADIDLSEDCDLQGYVTPIYEANGLIEIAHRVKPFLSYADFKKHEDEAAQTLNTLSEKYLLDDVGPSQWANWGYCEELGCVIIDFAYLVRLEALDFTCCKPLDNGSECQGQLEYNNTMTALVCPECGATRTFGDIKNRDTNAIANAAMMRSIDKFNNECYDDAEYI